MVTGASSRCVPLGANPLRTVDGGAYDPSSSGSGCFHLSCDAGSNLFVSLLGRSVACPSGQTVNLATALPGVFTSGTLGPCPDNAGVCSSLGCGACSPRSGRCIEGTCRCSLLYSGADCSVYLGA